MITAEVKTCRTCRSEVVPSVATWNHGLCDSCYTWERDKEDRRETSKTQLEVRIDRWEKLCPEIYRKNSTDFIDASKFRLVTSWKFGSRGLLCSGDSRRGKTTSCWHLVHKLFILEARTFVGLSEPEFSILREKYSRQGTLEYWLNKCIAADVFFLDDIGHAASTARHMEELYHIIEKRTSWNKPIIATTQFTLQDIEDKSGKSSTTKTAMAILNRLLSFCDKVQF